MLVLVLALILILCFAVVFFYYFQLRRNRSRKVEQPDIAGTSNLGTCVKCRQQRIIVKKEAGLCAFCWSSINTKPS